MRFDDQLWEVLDVSYVTPIAAADEAAIRDGLVAHPDARLSDIDTRMSQAYRHAK